MSHGVRIVLDVRKDGRIIDSVDLTQRAVTTFGRNSQACDVVLDHPSISRVHAKITHTGGATQAQANEHPGADGHAGSGADAESGGTSSVNVKDCGSAHGTFVNGEQVPKGGERALRLGDAVSFGGSSRAYVLRVEALGAHAHAGTASGTAGSAGVTRRGDDAGISGLPANVTGKEADALLMPPPPPRPPRASLARQVTRGDAADEAVNGESGRAGARAVSEAPFPMPPSRSKPTDTDSDIASSKIAERRAREAEIAAIRASFAQAPVFRPTAPSSEESSNETMRVGQHHGTTLDGMRADSPSHDDAGDGSVDGEDEMAAMARAAGLPLAFGGGARARNAERMAGRKLSSNDAANDASESVAASAGDKRRRPDDEDDELSRALAHGNYDDENVGAGSRADDVAEELGLPISHEVMLAPHARGVSAIAMEPSGARVLTGSLDYTLRLYDFGGMDAGHRPFRELMPHDGQPITSLAYSPQGDRFIVGTGDARPKVYDREGKHLRTFLKGDMYITDMVNTKGHVASISSVRWHPTNADVVFTASADGSARFWNLNGRTIFEELVCGDVIKFKNARGVKAAITSATLSHDGGSIVAGCDDGSVQLVHVRGAGHRYVRPDSLVREAHSQGDITAVAMSPDDRYIASRSAADDCVRIWDVRKLSSGVSSAPAPGKTAHPACVGNIIDVPTFHSTANVEWSPDGKYVVVGTDAKRGSSEVGRLLLYKCDDLGERVTTGASQADATYQASVCTGAAAAVVLWHPRIQQIAVGCGDGATRVLYRPGVSTKGALMSSARAPKRRELVDSLPTGKVINPDALPMYREDVPGLRTKKRIAGAPAPAARTMPGPETAPESEPEFVHKGVRTFTQVFMEQHRPGVNLREQDPAAVLRAYASKVPESLEGQVLRKAYSHSQPKSLLAERTIEDEEERQREELEAVLRGNIAGK